MNAFFRFLLQLFILISVLTVVCVFRAIVYFPKPLDVETCSTSNGHKAIANSDALQRRFSQALRFKTITKSPGNYDKQELIAFRSFIEKSFPKIHSSPLVKREIVGNYSLIYTIKGTDTSLRPYMLCSHLDVVPVEREKWNVNPFGGQIKDGYFYGRGTIDVKNTLMASLEALEHLLSHGFKPKRSFYLAFGHDEEGSGHEGAVEIAKVMKARHDQLEYILDEGSMILNGTFAGIEDTLIGMISVTEKGYVSVKLEVNSNPGHSSLAPSETTIVTLSKALSKFNSVAFPSRFGYGPEKDIFEFLAPYASFPYKLVYSNLWLFKHLVVKFLSTTPLGNSLIRTSTAVTIVNGGVKENVLPSSSFAVINHRIHPSQTVKEVLQFDEQLINDERIKLSITNASSIEAHPVSPYDDNAYGFQAIKRSIREVFPGTVVIPGIMLASTDTKWYLKLSPNIYRFSPTIIKKDEFILFHGNNERISVKNYVQTVNFYHHLMLISDDKQLKQIKPTKDEL